MTRMIEVSYPTGAHFIVEGEFMRPVALEGCSSHPLINPSSKKGTTIALDPRAIVEDANTGELLYHPRRPETGSLLIGVMRTWIDTHPGWAPIEL